MFYSFTSVKLHYIFYCVHVVVCTFNALYNVYMYTILFLTTGQLKRGEYVFRQCENLVANVWRDKRLVYTMSTNTNPTATTTCLRKKKDGSTNSVTIPLNTTLYNIHMGGVDKVDQLRGYYQWKMKSRKFYL